MTSGYKAWLSGLEDQAGIFSASLIFGINAFREETAICFFPRLSESISDLVSRSETDEVIGFVGSECGWGDLEDLFDFEFIALLDFFDDFLIGEKLLGTTGVYKNQNPGDDAVLILNVIGQKKKGSVVSDKSKGYF